MADKPILFSGPMVRALIEGRKTQTRRIPKIKWRDGANQSFTGWHPERVGGRNWQLVGGMGVGANIATYAVGDRLWVREHWRSAKAYDDLAPSEMGGEEPLKYEADGAEQMWGWPELFMPGRHRQGMHMPRWASRLTLTVTEVRVERLQDIGDADAVAEGVEMESADPPFYYVPGIWPHSLTAVGIEEAGGRHAAKSYAKLWNHIHGPGAWAENPWVSATSFSVEKINIDQKDRTQ